MALRGIVCLLLLIVVVLPSRAAAGDNLFNSGTAMKQELSRVADEGKLFVQGPIDPYLAETLAVAGAFGVAYAFDEDIRSDLAGVHSRKLNGLADFGSLVGNPFVHIGVAAAAYSAGAVADAPRVMRFGQELGEALLFADGATVLLGEAIGRGRPYTGKSNSRYRPFNFNSDYDSLPSTHTASSFAVAHVVASETDSIPAKALCYALAGLVGFSRMYQEKHWASDVVLGAAIGELAGNSVTRLRDLRKGEVTVAPVVMGGTPTLAVVGRF